MCRNDSIIVTSIKIGEDLFEDIDNLTVGVNTYLVIYASGWLSPTITQAYNLGKQLELVAKVRHEINQKNNPKDNCVIAFCPTDTEFFETINMYANIKRLDIYSHGWIFGLNLGGFKGKREVDGIEMDSSEIDWDSEIINEGRDLRRVEIFEDLAVDPAGDRNEIEAFNLKSDNFHDSVEVYFWGCNIGGQISSDGRHIGQNKKDGTIMYEDPRVTFAQHFAVHIGKGTVYALVGRGYQGGSMFKLDANGKEYYKDGEMLPANIVENYKKKGKPSSVVKAIAYMKMFPIK